MGDIENNPSVFVLCIGGTIDAKPYKDPFNPPLNAEMLPHTQVKEALESLGHNNVFVAEYKYRKDSKDFIKAPELLDELADHIISLNKNGVKKILLTCGTDALFEIGRRLQEKLEGKFGGYIGMCGGYIPLSNGFILSDKVRNDSYDNLDNGVKTLQYQQSEKGKFFAALDRKVYRITPTAEKEKTNYPQNIIKSWKQNGALPYHVVNADEIISVKTKRVANPSL